MNLISKIFIPKKVCAAWDSGCTMNGDVAKIQGFECLFENIAQVVVYFAGIVFFIMFIKGGFSYLTSGGDPKKTAKASHSLIMSVMGIVGVILSFLIIRFIGTFAGVNVTDFEIPT